METNAKLLLLAAYLVVSSAFAGEGVGRKHSHPATAPAPPAEALKLSEEIVNGDGVETIANETDSTFLLEPETGTTTSCQNGKKYSDYPWAVNQPDPVHHCHQNYFRRNAGRLFQKACISTAVISGAVATGAALVGFGPGIIAVSGEAHVFGDILMGSICTMTSSALISLLSGILAYKISKHSLQAAAELIYPCDHPACLRFPFYKNVPNHLRCPGNKAYLLHHPVMIRGSGSLYSLEYVLELILTGQHLPGSHQMATWDGVISWKDLDSKNRKRVMEAYNESSVWKKEHPPLLKHRFKQV